MKLDAPTLEWLTIKLIAIVGYKGMGGAVQTDNSFPKEISYVSCGDDSQRFSFHPFCKIINSYHDEPASSLSRREWSDQVNPPLCERP